MAERVIIEEGKKYYGGGTVPKIAGHGGITDIPMAASEYAPEPIKPKMVYRGGTTPRPVSEGADDTDDMGRELIK